MDLKNEIYSEKTKHSFLQGTKNSRYFLRNILYAVCILLALSGTASATDYYVATWGDDAHTGLTHEQSVRSLDHALSLMGAGDTLYMSDGTWSGEILDFWAHGLQGTPGNPVTVKAYDGNPTMSNGPSGVAMIKTSYQDWITIDGITVTNGYTGYLAEHNSHLVIRNSKFSNMDLEGIDFRTHTSDTLVENNVITNCVEHGIHYFNQMGTEIMYNHVIRNNDISNSGHNLLDIHTRINDVIVEDNELYFTSDYSGLKQVGLYLHNGDTDNIIIRNNYFHDQPRPLEIFNSEDVVIEYNRFEDINGRALMLSSFNDANYDKNARVYNIYFRNNVIENVDYGVLFWGEESIYQNIYITNNTLSNVRNYDFWIYSGTFKNPIIIGDNLPREQSKTFLFRVYPIGAISVVDSSNAIMVSDDESITVSNVDASSIKVESSDRYLTVNTYPMYAHPTTGPVNVEVNKYDTSLPQGETLVDFTAESTDGENVVFTVGDLQPNRYYNIKMDGVDFTSKQADSSGQIKFTSSEWSVHSFSVEEASSAPSNLSPTANAGSGMTVVIGETISFDGSGSTDDKGIVSHAWDFDASNGIQKDATGTVVQHSYDAAGTYTVTLTVEDADGKTDSDTVTVTVTTTVSEVNHAPVIIAFKPVSGAVFDEGDSISLDVTASDADGDALSYTILIDGVIRSTSSNYVWNTDNTSAGTHRIEAIVSDGLDQVTSIRTITINDEPIIIEALDIVQGTATVDGDLSDWQDVTGITLTASTSRDPNEDNTAVIKAKHDDNYLYLVFDVTDTNLQASGQDEVSHIYLDDSVEIFLDTQHDNGGVMQADDYHFIINLNGAVIDEVGTGGGKDLSYASSIMTGITLLGSNGDESDTDTGYVIEVAIPWSDIGGKPSNDAVGLNVGINDRDNGFDGRQYFDSCSLTGSTNDVPNNWGDAIIVATDNIAPVAHPRWDVNKDGVVNILDITLVSQNMGSQNLDAVWDVNQDDEVNIQDLTLVAHHFGETVE